jgi:hypothetical protein
MPERGLVLQKAESSQVPAIIVNAGPEATKFAKYEFRSFTTGRRIHHNAVGIASVVSLNASRAIAPSLKTFCLS